MSLGWKDAVGIAFPGIPLTHEIDKAIYGDQDKINSRNQQAADQAGNANYAMQKEFAQNSIRWKIEDARQAGISPLAALGASGYSASPSYVGSTSQPRSELFPSLAGQGILRAIDATQTAHERIETEKRLMESPQYRLSLEHGSLENDLLREQILNARASRNPPMPVLDHQMVKDATGEYYLAPSAEYGQASQGDFMPGVQWHIRNKIMPMFEGADDVGSMNYINGSWSDPRIKRYRNENLYRRDRLRLLEEK